MSSTRRLTARGRERRQKLIEVATARFAQQGFHPTSVSDIVDGVGVGKGVFYWYFPSKDELLLEILRDSHYDLRRAQIEAIGDESDPIRRIERGIEASLTWSAAHPEILRLVMFGWTEETFAKALRKGRRIAIGETARHVREAMDQGLIAEGDPVILATAIRGVTDELSRQYVMGGRPLDEQVVRSAVRMCLYGVVGQRT
jgi:AcrR family transcriptional regulator